ncbi:MAG: DUF3667 domain-containing protein [Chitinophagaceae bacterium]|nr:DUF3667 domain-containing protein [Chitinophagaceae bacterium]
MGKKKFEKYRIEKHCLNCQIPIHGNYCHNCGQANLDHRHNFFTIIFHYIGDLFHWDHKIFTTAKKLLFSPGMLTKTYIEGARKRYIDPIKLYVFLSAVFFIFLHYNHQIEDLFQSNKDKALIALNKQYTDQVSTHYILKKIIQKDSILLRDTLVQKRIAYYKQQADSIGQTNNNIDYAIFKFFNLSDTLEVVDGGLSIVTDEKGQIKSMPRNKLTDEIDEKYFGDYSKLKILFVEKIMNLLPKVVFGTIPIYAFLLFISCIRRKENYFVNHFIFAMHLYSFLFLLYIFTTLFQDICGWFDNAFTDGLSSAIFWLSTGYFLIYIGIAMQKFIPSGIGKLILRYLIVHGLMFLITMVITVSIILFLFIY